MAEVTKDGQFVTEEGNQGSHLAEETEKVLHLSDERNERPEETKTAPHLAENTINVPQLTEENKRAPQLAEETKDGPLYLGFDLSTQQLKAVIIDDTLKILHEASVHYDSELPEFRTHGGVVINKSKVAEITAPPAMWLKALDILLERLRLDWGLGELFGRVKALSGAAQQHGTVYWHRGAARTIGGLSSSAFLHGQLASSFSLPQTPVWRDHSTSVQCARLAEALNGNDNLAKITGSIAHERFSAAQICKIAETKPQVYTNTERISLISSFLCSVFLGRYAPIDWSDGSGMNLLDIRTHEWDAQCLAACAPGLCGRLGEPCSPNTVLGPIATYFVERFGFNPECQVIAFTGDNPSSLAGLGLGPGELALSLGSSDTIFAWVPEYITLQGGRGHLLCNPVDPQHYMALLCFANGSLTREKVRNRMAERSWEKFCLLLDSTPRGNFGNIGIFTDAPEPLMPQSPVGEFRFNAADCEVSHFTSPEIEVRALVEGQALSRRAVLESQLGQSLGTGLKIIATGGGSKNIPILQVYADVFNAPVYIQEGSNSAAYGGALRAQHVMNHPDQLYSDTICSIRGDNPPVCTPYADAEQIYNPLLARWLKLNQKIIDSASSTCSK